MTKIYRVGDVALMGRDVCIEIANDPNIKTDEAKLSRLFGALQMCDRIIADIENFWKNTDESEDE